MEQRTVTIKNFLRITKIVQVSAMKVHFQIAERSLFYLNPDIQHRRMTYPPERVGGGFKRDTFIRINNAMFGINSKRHGFKTFYYGVGILWK